MCAYPGAAPRPLLSETALRKGYDRDHSPSAVARQDRIQ